LNPMQNPSYTKSTKVKAVYTVCPTTYQTRQFFNNFTTNEDIAQQLGAHYRHIRLHFSPLSVLLFKSRSNIFIGLGIIKELPNLVGSGTPYITGLDWPTGFQEFEAPRFQDIRHKKVVRLSAVHTGLLYLPRNVSVTYFC
jgi:hypothetical protein